MAEPREHPILFSREMVRAILDGTKTQTRRVVTSLFLEPFGEPTDWEPQHYSTWRAWCHATNQKEHFSSPYGVPGDRLWVRETWRTAKSLDADSPKRIEERCLDAGYSRPWAPLQYEADGHQRNWLADFAVPGTSSIEPGKTRVSIHMPRWASRLSLEVVIVRVERLQDITEEDARAEGVERYPEPFTYGWRNYEPEPSFESVAYHPTARESFASLWRSINGPESWDDNPWVWVLTFRRVEAPTP